MKELVLGVLTGHGPVVPLLALTIVGLLIFLITARLARHADAIAEATGLGRLWIGTVLLAASTSLPEATTAANAGLLEEPNIGAADLLGASLANLVILATLDLAFARRRILHNVATDHVFVALLGMLLAGIVGLALFTGGWGSVAHVGLETFALAIVYATGMTLLYRSKVTGAVRLARSRASGTEHGRLTRAIVAFTLAAAGLALLAPLLVLSADAVATEADISATFVGTLLVGLSTSLPELAATVSAVRMGALDLAAGNVFGSVTINMLLFVVLDAAYGGGPVFTAIAPDHLVTVLLLVVSLALALLAVLSRQRRRPGPVLVESAGIVAVYLLGVWWLYRSGG